jgi:hypothetical protein
MTQLYLHPLIEDYFAEYDFAAVRRSPADGGATDLRRKLMEDYAAGKIVLLRGVRIDYDRRFVSALEIPASWEAKKLQTRIMERRKPFWASRAKRRACRELFGGDMLKYLKFQNQVRAVNGALREVLGELLVHHRVSQTEFVWRLTETRVENLHFDVDQGAGAFEAVRLYVNMDDIPRIWQTGHPLRRLFFAYREALGLDRLAAGTPEKLLSVLNGRLFGPWSTRGREPAPHHVVLFEPGDVWLCDGRRTPHQVLYGRRVVSSFYRLDNAALPPWSPPLADELRRWAAAPPEPDAAPGIEGFRAPLPPGGPPEASGQPDLKALRLDWRAAQDAGVQPRLVRL